ncbi:uncharacterized protein LOC135843511 [Planococcus citri]|uniref:uncharacterized protein LOC135843511 n=1 Tax=Planococcus citri TaxID=170843 RepID=UPI0031F824A2
MLRTGIILKKCWLVLVLFEFGNYAIKEPTPELFIIEKTDCTEITLEYKKGTKSKKCMNCSSTPNFGKKRMRVLSLPVGLETKLECLYMKNLNFGEKNDKTMFKDYPHLTHLHMIRNSLSDETEIDIFEMLTNLERLDLFDTSIKPNREYNVPKSVRFLDYTNLNITTLNLEHLHMLEELVVSKTRLRNFPKLHDLAPIQLVELKRMNMINFTLDEFAKYCNIEEINMDNTTLGNDGCTCHQLIEWVKKYGIKMEYPPNCQPDNKCSLEFSQASLKNREVCLAKNSHKTLYLIIAGAVLLLLLIVLAIIGLATYLLYPKLMKREIEEGIEVKEPVKEETVEEEAAPDDEIVNK